MQKIATVFLVMLIGNFVNAQELRPFAGLGASVHLYSFEKDLQSSPAISLSAGAEYKLFGFFLPEVEANYMFGKFKNRSESNSSTSINSSDKTFSIVNFSFAPKIALGDYSDKVYFQIFPKYIYSIINAQETTNTNKFGSVAAEKSTSVSQHNFGLGIGLVFNFDTWYSNSLAINVCYNTIRVSAPFDQLNPGTERTDNVGVYGIEFKYYFGVKRLK